MSTRARLRWKRFRLRSPICRRALAELKSALSDHSAETALAEAKHAQEALLPAMAAVRAAADTLESVVADDLWPLPTYQEMLYIL